MDVAPGKYDDKDLEFAEEWGTFKSDFKTLAAKVNEIHETCKSKCPVDIAREVAREVAKLTMVQPVAQQPTPLSGWLKTVIGGIGAGFLAVSLAVVANFHQVMTTIAKGFALIVSIFQSKP